MNHLEGNVLSKFRGGVLSKFRRGVLFKFKFRGVEFLNFQEIYPTI